MTRNTVRFTFTWPAAMAQKCKIMNATGSWRHGSETFADGYQINESVSTVAWRNAAAGVAAELKRQGIEYTMVLGTYER